MVDVALNFEGDLCIDEFTKSTSRVDVKTR